MKRAPESIGADRGAITNALNRSALTMGRVIPMSEPECHLVGDRDAEYWAQVIADDWRATVEGIIKTGRDLVAAQDALDHGEWQRMTGRDGNGGMLPFGYNTAHRLQSIAKHPAMLNVAHAPHLPASWMTLYQLTRLEDLPQRIEAGEITPDIDRATVTKWLKQQKSKKKQAKNGIETQPDNETCTVDDLQKLIEAGKQFGCIYADPPWVYNNQGTRAATGNHYSGLTVDELCELPIMELAADSAHLHLWTTNGFLFECQKIFEAWGFEFRSSFIWVKPQMGIGNYWRNSHEILLTAIRGDAKRFNDKSLKSWIQSDRTAHSAKPEIIREYLMRASAGPYLELFGRRAAEDWVVWGNQIKRSLFDSEVAEL